MTSPQVPLRNPYVGSGADGARRSAQIDQEEADCLPPGEYRDHCLPSAERWILQAEHLEAQPRSPGDESARPQMMDLNLQRPNDDRRT